MKLLHIGKEKNLERYAAPDSFLYELERVTFPIGLPVEQYVTAAGDADFIIADAIGEVSGELIEAMPRLRLIHSEGVAYNKIDIEAARKKHVYVCNSRGMNASAVAEQTILLMLGMLRDVVGGDRAVREGRQISVKEGYMQRGDLRELPDCSVGLVGFGDIGRETAKLLRAFGVKRILCTKQTPLSPVEEEAFGVRFCSVDQLLAESDIVSLHLPVTADTAGMAGSAFFSAMKDGALFVNTSRGELVDDAALIDAIASGKIAMAAIDTLDNEPVRPDHPLINVPDSVAERLLFSPHIGGITASSFRRSYAMIAEDIRDAAEGRVPKRVVNPW
ncbi:MAG: hydroxyacid dehydrogenase [Oscillospiraceae bacterium]|nr:hydroxyacid dehydrogenase [Oscillospiraceae bacterium]